MTASSQALTTTVYTVTPDASVSNVAHLMASQGVSDVIVTEDQRPVGVLTDRDIVLRVIGAGLDAKVVRVREVMSQPPVTVSRDAEVGLAIGLMGLHGIRRLPIVDEDRRLVSILTMDDIILLGLNNLPELQHIVHRQLRPGEKPSARPASPKVQASAQDITTPTGERAFSGPVAAIARPSAVVPMGRGYSYPVPRTRRDAARAWFYHNRSWPLIVFLLSLAGAALVLITDYYGRTFYGYSPQHYEPKDIERQRHLLQEEIRRLDEQKRK